ncbi:hypothetical protein V7148_11450 [Gottfriedia acidiceleris]|uniref:hypothetical protein n=1 Tax=Gottfriedia acidiceleris TaxID=371036 RepID=UPI002FFD9FAF
MQEVKTFEWISYEVDAKEEIEMILPKVNVIFKGKESTGEQWSETKEVYRIAPHILLEFFEESDEFVFRVLNKKHYRDQEEIIIDLDTHNKYVKSFGGYIDGMGIDWAEENQELIVSKTFIKVIESLANIN